MKYKGGIKNKEFELSEVQDGSGKYKIDIFKKDAANTPTTDVETFYILDEDANTKKAVWEIAKGTRKRGTGYQKADCGDFDKGHIKCIQEGAKFNTIEDSPINIIPQTYKVNHSTMRMFESYRSNYCNGKTVITDILDDGYVRVRIPDADEPIDVVYNPLSTKTEEWENDWYLKSGPFD